MMKLKRKSPAKRVLQCLSVNRIPGVKNRFGTNGKLLSPPSTKKSNKDAKKSSSKSRSDKAYHLYEVEDERLVEWDTQALTSPSLTNPITVSGTESFDAGNHPGRRNFDFPAEVEGTVVSALTAPGSIDKQHDEDEDREEQVEEGEDAKTDSLVWNSDAFKNFQQLQSVQSDLRKAVHALVSLRTKSDGARSGQMLPYATDEMRKDISTVQGSVTLAKDQVDELCAEWARKSKLPESSSVTSCSTEELFEELSLVSSSAPNARAKSHARHGRDKADCAIVLDVRDACGRYSTGAMNAYGRYSTETMKRSSSLAGLSEAAAASENTIESTASNKELLAVRAERDGLARANQSLISTLKTVMKELEEAQERVQYMEQKLPIKDQTLAKDDADEDSSAISAYAFSCAGGLEPKRLTKTVQSLSAAMESLMEERDRLSMQLHDATQNLARVREQSGKLEEENLELKHELDGTTSQLKEASSDGKNVSARGRIISASLVFTRNELAQATQRIQELERTVIRLQQQASSGKTSNYCDDETSV